MIKIASFFYTFNVKIVQQMKQINFNSTLPPPRQHFEPSTPYLFRAFIFIFAFLDICSAMNSIKKKKKKDK